MDVTPHKPDGTHWDFSRRADRHLAERLLDQDQPDWAEGSPPCTAYSLLNFGMNYPKMDPTDVQKKLRDANIHIDFYCRLY